VTLICAGSNGFLGVEFDHFSTKKLGYIYIFFPSVNSNIFSKLLKKNCQKIDIKIIIIIIIIINWPHPCIGASHHPVPHKHKLGRWANGQIPCTCA